MTSERVPAAYKGSYPGEVARITKYSPCCPISEVYYKAGLSIACWFSAVFPHWCAFLGKGAGAFNGIFRFHDRYNQLRLTIKHLVQGPVLLLHNYRLGRFQ